MVIISKEEEPIPQPDLSYKHEIRVIKFSKRSEEFCCDLPKHIGDTVKHPHIRGTGTSCQIVDRKAVNKREPTYTVFHGTIRGIRQAWDEIMREYKRILREKKKKIILVNFQANVAVWEFHDKYEKNQWPKGENAGKCILALDEISFCKTPAMQLHFIVAHQSGVQIFDLINKYLGTIDSYDDWAVMDYTEERYQFFMNTQRSFEKMIAGIDGFIQKLKEEPLMLDSFIKNGNLLPEAKGDVDEV